MSDTTDRLALPLLAAGQAQKEMAHNEALALLDLLVQPAVEAIGLDLPPADPAEGACWVVGPAPVGDWADQAGALAGWTAAGWRFVPAFDGARVWSRQGACDARFVDGAWRIGVVQGRALMIDGQQVVGPRGPAIADPAGGTMADAEARAAIGAILTALRAHGLVAA
ncbi:DUF2793 domain-containing protein [Sphingomonas aracearum]|uniref:DUF2793 domain-containing protein n=1 Tax=Sphingomonas aracearum TaxID=2283317 RepID=A0A369VT24_9SPHN|nr:DUF2793 domain-containing protein [Sphingomonas aracearum]RDE04815.1 DUF2793 domain-containing protein [Sphingomonas aracearum]